MCVADFTSWYLELGRGRRGGGEGFLLRDDEVKEGAKGLLFLVRLYEEELVVWGENGTICVSGDVLLDRVM